MKKFLEQKKSAIVSGMSNNKGFSLVELIIVVAIMAVLMGVLAPQYLRFVETSREQSDVTAVNEMSKAMTIAMSTVEGVDSSASVTFAGDGTFTVEPAGGAFETEITKTIAAGSISFSSNWAMNNAPKLSVKVSGGIPSVYCATTNTSEYSANDTWATRLSIAST